jgi:predicted GH43/DUF377 family glycosyl hydrolase
MIMETMFNKKVTFKKLGLIIRPQKEKFWFRSHAMIPTPESLGKGFFRIYFSGRNDNNQSHIGWADVDLNEPLKVPEYSEEPVLYPGSLGCFDDNGVTPSCIISTGSNEKLLYYIGWNPGSTVRMHLFGGLAIRGHDGTFKRWSRAPIIERCKTDPFLNIAPWVVKVDDEYLMYYVSGTEWKHKDLPRYNIKLARSKDGKEWIRDGHVCIDFKDDNENALARPYVLREDDVWKMWFSFKGDAYQLGYAESLDGLNWERRDDFSGISVGEKGDFDSDMISYAAVVKYKGRKFMFYNGNNYGYGGIGLAVEEL